MNKRSFKFITSFTLFMFLATPIGAFAQGSCQGGNCTPFASGGLLGSGNASTGAGGDISSIIAPLALMSAFGGLGRGGAGAGGFGGGGGGAGGQVGQILTLVGALTGNMGLLMAGLITSMLGGLGGGNTPQQGFVDEGYVGQGQGYGNGYGNGYGSGYGNSYGNQGYDPYYPTPIPQPVTTVAPAVACSQSLFIVKDTTVTPNVTKPYPTSVAIADNGCVLAINSDSASHSVQAKQVGSNTVVATQSIGGQQSHIFRFTKKQTYTLCVDSSVDACTTVAVQ